MKGLPAETDFIVIGAGIAGLRAAIELAEAGRVLVFTKNELPDLKSKDPKLEAAWLSDSDDVILHLQDTVAAGDGIANPAAAKILVEDGAERIDEVIAWGKHADTTLSFEPENAHTRSRVLHAAGEPTGKEILRVLLDRVRSLKHVSVAEFTFATSLLSDGGRIVGVSFLDDKGVPCHVSCSAVLIASGGCGQIYRCTNYPEGATGDGIAMAYRTGAEISDMEFVQFHPTALHMKKVPQFLLPERLRNEGGYLRNLELDRFMGKYHPLVERAPRYLVARAIVHEMEVSRAKDSFVYLDLTHMNASKLHKSFPLVYESCMAYNIDITEDLIPVRPAAYGNTGGIRTDLDGKTNVPGLYAAGEAAATGVHGSRQIASNCILECLVFGARAGRAMRNAERTHTGSAEPKALYSNGPVDTGIDELVGRIQDLMWKEVGVVRMRPGMQNAAKTLEDIAPRLAHPRTRRAHEAANLHLCAQLVTRSALAREESRGSHYRIDYPDHEDRRFSRHSVIRGEKVLFPLA